MDQLGMCPYIHPRNYSTAYGTCTCTGPMEASEADDSKVQDEGDEFIYRPCEDAG